MLGQDIPADTPRCIWMSAGLVTYKLCDRQFDCDHCPLDAGLRMGTLSDRRGVAHAASSKNTRMFPDDRTYTGGHAWLKAVGQPDERRQRLGLDAFAAAIIGRCSGISEGDTPRTVSKDEVLCQIDLGLGTLPLRAPLNALIVGVNPALCRDPGLLVTTPYEDGWIVEVQTLENSGLDGLMTAEAAQKRMRMDLQRFRRRIAVQLFVDQQVVGPTAADGGEPLADLRQMLGGSFYLDLLHELIH